MKKEGEQRLRIIKSFAENELRIGRKLGKNRRVYLQKYPFHTVYFNASVIVEGLGKVWHGDLDMGIDSLKLQNVSNSSTITLYVLPEELSTNETLKAPFEIMASMAVKKFSEKRPGIIRKFGERVISLYRGLLCPYIK